MESEPGTSSAQSPSPASPASPAPPPPGAIPEHIAEALLQSPSFLHRFGLFLEEVQPAYRPLLYFCVDVERLRILSGSLGLPVGEAPASDCEFIAWTYFKRGGPRNLQQCCGDELGELPDADGPPIPLSVLLELQKKAQGVLQEKLLPAFLQQQGDLLAPKDREALEAIHAKYNDEIAQAAPEAETLATEAIARASAMQRNKYLAGLGIHARGGRGGLLGPGASRGPGDPGTRGKPGKPMAPIAEGGAAAADGPVAAQNDAAKEGELPNGWAANKADGSDSSYQSSADGKEPARGAEATEAPEVSEKDTMPKKDSLREREKTSLDDFKVQKVLGKGSFGTVVKVIQKSTAQVYAMKVMSKKELIRKKALRHIRRERSVLEYVSHPFVVGLLHAFITEAKVYLVLEYCAGGDLHQHLMAADHTRFPEPQARFYTAELVLALEYLHELGVIYRDLKPENVLLDQQGHVRLADFGLCRAGVQDDAAATSFCGSPAYLSPEMVSRNGHGQATDWWGLGVLLYEMLTGDPPFQGRDIEGLFNEIKESEVQLAPHTKISPEALSLIKGLLAKESNQRLKASECKTHEFFNAHSPPLHTPEDWQRLFNKEYRAPFVPPDEDQEETSTGEGPDKKKQPGCLVM